MKTLIPAWVERDLAPVDEMVVHLNGIRHPAASVFVIDGSRTLIQRRSLSKIHSTGLWGNTCCAHPQVGETTADAATRQLEESLGITGLVLNHAEQVEYRAFVGMGMIEHEVVDIFVAEMSGNADIDINVAEVMDTRWVDVAEVAAEVAARPGRFTPWFQVFLAEHSEAIFSTLPGRLYSLLPPPEQGENYAAAYGS